jgi:hypothetical protein
MAEPSILKSTWSALEVAVPVDWTDEQILDFVRERMPEHHGVPVKWFLMKEGDHGLFGEPERLPLGSDLCRVKLSW